LLWGLDQAGASTHALERSREKNMHTGGRLLIGLMVLLSLSGCGTTVVKPQWVFEKEAIKLHIKADHRLNMFNGRAHTLYMCAYQLKDLNGLDQLSQDSAGIRQLLECRLFDESVAAAASKVIHAGENITLILDRAERARHLVLVAGYSDGLVNERVIRRHKFRASKHRDYFYSREYQCSPCDLEIDLSLGPYQIEYSKIMPSPREYSDECD
jgi:predicted restriction endonuclease